MKNIRFGKIASYDSRAEAGFMNVISEPALVPFTLQTLRNVAAGFLEPEFALIEDKLSLLLDVNVDDLVVVSLEVDYRKESTPSRHTIRRVVKITDWGFTVSYNDAWRIIKSRPIFEVVEFTLYNGVPTSRNQKRVINHGTAIGLQAVYPRGAENDPLAPEKQLLGFTYSRRFYLVGPGASRVQCPDPRELPHGQQEDFQPTNEQGVLLATKEEVVLGLSGSIDCHGALVTA